MGILSNLFKWISGIFRRKGTAEKAVADVKKDEKEEKDEEKFVEDKIGEVAEDLVETQHAEQIIKKTEKIEESGQVTGKSLEEVEKEEQEMILKMEEFEKELSEFRKQLDQILTREEQQDEEMEQKIELGKEKSEAYRQQLSSNVDVFDKQWENIFHEVELISGRVEAYIKSHRSTVESVRQSLDQSIISTQESIEEIRKIKEKGHIIISLFKSLEFRMSALRDRMINSEKELENSRERRDKFLEGWFELMDEELELEREGYASEKFSEQAREHHEEYMESYRS